MYYKCIIMVGKLIVENFLIIKERNKDYGEL